MNSYKFFSALAFIILLYSCNIGIESSYPKSDWTIMIYLADDFNTIGLINDLKEAVYNQQNTSDIRLVILYNGSLKEADIDRSTLVVLDSPFSISYKIIDLADTSIPVNSGGELDLSSQETLEAYISYTKEKLPADNYALLFGSHGTGFQSAYDSGLAVEYFVSEDNGLLTVEEIANGVKNQGGIDLVYFDACNLGNIETIYQFKDSSVDYIIASPELIPGNGNQYTDLLTDIYSKNHLTTEDLGESILKSYSNFYENNNTSTQYKIYGSSYTKTEPTSYLLQMYNVDKIVGLVESNNFKNDIVNFTSNLNNSNRLYNFESSIKSIPIEYERPNYVDLYDLYTYKEELDNCIITPIGATRRYISIYVPTHFFNTDYINTLFNLETGWSSNIEAVSNTYYP